jgi:membrane protein DedA with SNARE-associated domain
MRRSLRILVPLTLAAIAVPLVPFLLFGTRLDHAVAAWLDPPPPPALLAAAEVALLAVDLFLPVPSSMVATLGGASLGMLVGTACAWVGMTAGAVAGWSLGRLAGPRISSGREPDELAAVERPRERLGSLFIVLTRPVPLVAEAAALLAGATRMPFSDFLVAAGAGNLAIAAAWTAAGAFGVRSDSLQWMLLAAIAAPVAATWLVARSRFWQDRRCSRP